VTVDKEILLLVFGTFNVDVDVDVSIGCFDRIMPQCSKELSCWHEETGLSRNIVWYRVHFAIENRRVVRLQHGNNVKTVCPRKGEASRLMDLLGLMRERKTISAILPVPLRRSDRRRMSLGRLPVQHSKMLMFLIPLLR
jgi:hypothetical protein